VRRKRYEMATRSWFIVVLSCALFDGEVVDLDNLECSSCCSQWGGLYERECGMELDFSSGYAALIGSTKEVEHHSMIC
jgi:hypothetical protein